MSTHKREYLQEERQSVVIVFSGDSGDGMQLTGGQFTNTSAVMGNDVSTFPDIPAEIRAPAGTIPGLSGYQVNFAANDLYTAGDSPQVLVAMNPAALKANLSDSRAGRIHHRQYRPIQPQWPPQGRVRAKPA